MGKLVMPEVYLVGFTGIDREGLKDYLRASGNEDFIPLWHDARAEGLSDGEILCSFYAKLCYAALSLGHNQNLTRTRDVIDNLKACFDQGHGSVFEHAVINFVVRNCSRVFTHELVRHRVGTAFSQTSGRYVRGDSVDVVFDPILEPVRFLVEEAQEQIEAIYADMVAAMGLQGREGLRRVASTPRANPWAGEIVPTDEEIDKWTKEKLGVEDVDQMPFDKKKKITSALRRILPNGQSNEIGFSVNLRALRHVVQMRTSRSAEWEIREVFGQMYRLTKNRWPLLYHGAKEEVVDGLVEVSGMKQQPY